MEGRVSTASRRRNWLRAGVLSLLFLAVTAAQPVFGAAVTDENLDASLAAAKTAADHEAIAAYYQDQAKKALGQVKSHQKMEKIYERWAKSTEHGVHCKRLIQTYEALAKDYEALAKDHQAMAKSLSK